MLKELFRIYPQPAKAQAKVLEELVAGGSDTLFGKTYGLDSVRGAEDFSRKVPLHDYDALEPYIKRMLSGENYLLWGQKCRYFAKSSGTSSSKSKFIPITPDNLHKCHLRGFKMMLASYISSNHRSRLFFGKSLTIAGTLSFDRDTGLYSGDLSGVLMRNSPKAADLFRIPKRSVALISDFDRKIAEINRLYAKSDVTSIAGVPAWNLLMIERLMELNNVSNLCELWPNMELFMHGGTGFGPYRETFRRLIPSERMHYLENYNASEGYFAFQDDLSDPGMLLTLNNGVYYEFIPMSRLEEAQRDAFLIRSGEPAAGKYYGFDTLATVRTGVDYAMVISTNAGLWRYLIGDCVRFTSLNPYKIIITGRTKLFINAFGEELMIGNTDRAIEIVSARFGVRVREYTVAPVFLPSGGAHQWLIEFIGKVPDTEAFADGLDRELQELNSDYEAKRTHTHTMERLRLTVLPEMTFVRWMESQGKKGGQNKVPRLSNDRKIVDAILAMLQ